MTGETEQCPDVGWNVRPRREANPIRVDATRLRAEPRPTPALEPRLINTGAPGGVEVLRTQPAEIRARPIHLRGARLLRQRSHLATLDPAIINPTHPARPPLAGAQAPDLIRMTSDISSQAITSFTYQLDVQSESANLLQ